MTSKKRTIAMILAAVLVLLFLLTACSIGGDTPTGDNTTPGVTDNIPTGDNSTPGTSSTPEATGGDSAPDAKEPPTWADPDTYDMEKKAFSDESIERASNESGVDIESAVEQAFIEYGEYINDNITPESVRTALALIISLPGISTADNISELPEKSIKKVNTFLDENGNQTLDIKDPTQNIAALAIAASLCYEPNYNDANNPVLDLVWAFGGACSKTDEKYVVMSSFFDIYYLPVE